VGSFWRQGVEKCEVRPLLMQLSDLLQQSYRQVSCHSAETVSDDAADDYGYGELKMHAEQVQLQQVLIS